MKPLNEYTLVARRDKNTKIASIEITPSLSQHDALVLAADLILKREIVAGLIITTGKDSAEIDCRTQKGISEITLSSCVEDSIDLINQEQTAQAATQTPPERI